MKLLLVSILLLAPLTALVPPSAADPCDRVARQTVGSGQGLYYVEARSHSGVAYVYKESNGISGLQRGDASPLTSDADDCVDEPAVTPDSRVA